MVTNLYERLVVAEPVAETVIPTVEVPNIWEDSVDVQVEKTREKMKRKKRKGKEVEKKAKVESIQDESDHETWVYEMAGGAGGSTAPIVVDEGADVVPQSIDSVSVIGTVVDKSGT